MSAPLITHRGQEVVNEAGQCGVVVSKGPDSSGYWKVAYDIKSLNHEVTTDWVLDCGKSYHFGSGYDITGPWVEPETVDLWVTRYSAYANASATFGCAPDRSSAQVGPRCTHLYHFTGTLGETLIGKPVWTQEGGEQDG